MLADINLSAVGVMMREELDVKLARFGGAGAASS